MDPSSEISFTLATSTITLYAPSTTLALIFRGEFVRTTTLERLNLAANVLIGFFTGNLGSIFAFTLVVD